MEPQSRPGGHLLVSRDLLGKLGSQLQLPSWCAVSFFSFQIRLLMQFRLPARCVLPGGWWFSLGA